MAVTAYSFLHTRRKPENKFKKAIISYLQTTRYSDQTDVELKIIVIEAKNCTVGDSIRIMMIDSQEEQAWAIASELKHQQYWSEMLEGCCLYMDEENNWAQEEYRQQIEQSKHRINLLRDARPERLIYYYENWDREELLAIYVVCSYEILVPENSKCETRTETFIITPDGETVIGHEPYGKLSLVRKRIVI